MKFKLPIRLQHEQHSTFIREEVKSGKSKCDCSESKRKDKSNLFQLSVILKKAVTHLLLLVEGQDLTQKY